MHNNKKFYHALGRKISFHLTIIQLNKKQQITKRKLQQNNKSSKITFDREKIKKSSITKQKTVRKNKRLLNRKKKQQQGKINSRLIGIP